MLLPPLVERLPELPGVRAYPRQPALSDGPPATRTEAIAYVIESPGSYALPALALDWWNTATATREAATTEPIALDVATPPGWQAPGAAEPPHPFRTATLLVLVGLALAAALLLARRRLRRTAPPSPRALRRAALAAARTDPPGAIRLRLAAWEAALPRPLAPEDTAATEAALREFERLAYGPMPAPDAEPAVRHRLVRAIGSARPARAPAAPPALPPLNPAYPSERSSPAG